MRTDLLLAGGLTALVVGAVAAASRAARTRVGDVVEVPVAAVSGTPPLPPGAPPLDPNLRLAAKVTLLKDGIVSAVPVGLAENGVIVTPAPANPGFAVSFPLSAIVRKVKV